MAAGISNTIGIVYERNSRLDAGTMQPLQFESLTTGCQDNALDGWLTRCLGPTAQNVMLCARAS
jgi:hypothetical protein